jgi:hypothetical protein
MLPGTLPASIRVVLPESHAQSEVGRSNVESSGWAGGLDPGFGGVGVMPQNPQGMERKFGSCGLCDGSISFTSSIKDLTILVVLLNGRYDLPCLVRAILLLGACFSDVRLAVHSLFGNL